MHSTKLEFQDFDLGSPSPDDSMGSNVNERDYTIVRTDSPVESAKSVQSQANKSFWTFEFYQQFFDVNTIEVKERIFWSVVPSRGTRFLENYLRPNPDLYGPIWICTTLVFTIAVGGNMADYLKNADVKWKYDFHLISTAATAIFSYAFLIPLVLYTFMTWNNSIITISFLELLCTFGYALSIYVPLSILWIIQLPWFQWTLVVIGAARSGYGLLSTIGPCIHGPKRIVVGIIVLTIHCLWSFGLMWFLFYYQANAASLVPPVTENIHNSTHTP